MTNSTTVQSQATQTTPPQQPTSMSGWLDDHLASMQDLQDEAVVRKLFDTIAPRFASRPGGYTRLLRVGFRKGDATDVAQVELVGSEFNPRAKAEAEAKKEQAAPKAKGVGGRLRAAAERLRGGRKSESAADHESSSATEATAAKRAAKKRVAYSEGEEERASRLADVEPGGRDLGGEGRLVVSVDPARRGLRRLDQGRGHPSPRQGGPDPTPIRRRPDLDSAAVSGQQSGRSLDEGMHDEAALEKSLEIGRAHV